MILRIWIYSVSAPPHTLKNIEGICKICRYVKMDVWTLSICKLLLRWGEYRDQCCLSLGSRGCHSLTLDAIASWLPRNDQDHFCTQRCFLDSCWQQDLVADLSVRWYIGLHVLWALTGSNKANLCFLTTKQVIFSNVGLLMTEVFLVPLDRLLLFVTLSFGRVTRAGARVYSWRCTLDSVLGGLRGL